MKPPLRSLCCSLVLAASWPLGAQEVLHVGDHPTGIPMRMRDFTFPSFLVLTFAPSPAMSLGQGRWGVELHLSKVNNFQVSDAVEDYLATTRPDDVRRRLDQADAEAIVAMPAGHGFFIDIETDILELKAHYGLTDRIDVGATLHYLRYSGGILDGIIEGFHDLTDFSQQGRNFVERDQTQVVIGREGQVFAQAIDGVSDGGFGDPFLFGRYTFPSTGRWRFEAELAVKPPLASSEDALSSGSWDVGLQLTADRRWSRDALIVNAAVVHAGDFEATSFRKGTDVPLLPAVHVTWIHSWGGPKNSRFFLQGLSAEHPLRDLIDSELTQLEVQLTAGVKWDTALGTWGVGLTKNLFNFDNTPDIGLHFSWGRVID